MVGRMDGRRERGKDPEEGRANVYQKVKSFFLLSKQKFLDTFTFLLLTFFVVCMFYCKHFLTFSLTKVDI